MSTWQTEEAKRFRAALIGHGSVIMCIGLIAGIILIFSMLNGVVIWPIIDLAVDIPGSTRGWKTTHVGGLQNGMLLIGIALALPYIPMSYASQKFVFFSFVATGWGNTLFYWAGNFSQNRGLSVVGTPYGEGDIYGAIAYFAGGSVMLFTIAASLVLASGAFRLARNYQ